MQEVVKKIFANRKLCYIVGGIVLIIIIVLIILILFSSNEKKLEKSLRKMGENFYKNYYEQLDSVDTDKENLLKNFESKGLKIDLEGLSQYKDNEELSRKMINKKTKEECNKNNTKVIIYPSFPFGENDYSLKIELDCGFEKK